MTERIDVQLTADVADFVKNINRAANVVNRVKKTTKKTSSSFVANLRRMATSVAVLDGPLGSVAGRINSFTTLVEKGNLAAALLSVTMAGVAAGFRNVSNAVSEAEVRLGAMEGVLKATGGAAGKTVEDIQVLARDIGEATLASTSEIERAATKVLTFKSITGDAFDQTLRAAQDLASTGFGTVTNAATQLAKVLELPSKGLKSLTRQGVSFSAEQENLIKLLEKTNRLQEAQSVILDVVAGQVGGVATQAASGFAGVVDTLGERWERLMIQLGKSDALKAVSVVLGFASDKILEILAPLEAMSAKVKTFQDLVQPNLQQLASWGIALGTTSTNIEDQANAADHLIARLKEYGVAVSDTRQVQELKIDIGLLTQSIEENESAISVLGDSTLPGFVTRVARANKELPRLRQSLKGATAALEFLEGAEERTKEAQRRRIAALQKEVDAEEEAEAARKKAAAQLKKDEATYQRLLDKIFPVEAAFRESAEAIAIFKKKLDEGKISADAFDAIKLELAPDPGDFKTKEEIEAEKAKKAIDDKKKMLDDAAKENFDALVSSLDNEVEAINRAKEEEIAIVEEAVRRKQTSEAQGAQAIAAIKSKSAKQLRSIEIASSQAIVSQLASASSTIMGLAQNEGRGRFNVAKATTGSIALVEGYLAVQKAYAEGGFPLAIATGIATAANVASIAATTYGSSGGSTGAGSRGSGGGVSGPSSVSQPTFEGAAASGTEVTVNLADDEDELVSSRGVRRLLQRIDEEIRSGNVTGLKVG